MDLTHPFVRAGQCAQPPRRLLPVRTACAVSLCVLGLGVPAAVHAQQGGAPTADTTALATFHATILRSNPELLARRAALDAARARLRATGFAAPAVLSAEAEEVPHGVDVPRAGSLRLTVDREFLTGGRRTAARSFAAADTALAAADLYAAERRVLAISTQALTREAGWAAIAQRLEDEDSTLSSAEASLRVRFATGGARYVDVLRLRTERLRVETERASALTESRVARQALTALVGRAAGESPTMTVLLDSLVAAHSAVLVATGAGPAGARALLPPAAPDIDSLLVASGVMRSADAAVAQAQAANRLVIASQRPRLTGFVGAQRFIGDNGAYTVGPLVGGSISLPFTARTANATASAAARGDVTAALAERTATLTGVRTELLAARARYEAARARLAVYNAALLTGAREERESALAGYRAGSLTLVELLDFERALARAEIDRLTSQIDAAVALSDLLTGASANVSGPPRTTRVLSASTSANAP